MVENAPLPTRGLIACIREILSSRQSDQALCDARSADLAEHCRSLPISTEHCSELSPAVHDHLKDFSNMNPDSLGYSRPVTWHFCGATGKFYQITAHSHKRQYIAFLGK
jgi:hypothetical protein